MEMENKSKVSIGSESASQSDSATVRSLSPVSDTRFDFSISPQKTCEQTLRKDDDNDRSRCAICYEAFDSLTLDEKQSKQFHRVLHRFFKVKVARSKEELGRFPLCEDCSEYVLELLKFQEDVDDLEAKIRSKLDEIVETLIETELARKGEILKFNRPLVENPIADRIRGNIIKTCNESDGTEEDLIETEDVINKQDSISVHSSDIMEPIEATDIPSDDEQHPLSNISESSRDIKFESTAADDDDDQDNVTEELEFISNETDDSSFQIHNDESASNTSPVPLNTETENCEDDDENDDATTEVVDDADARDEDEVEDIQMDQDQVDSDSDSLYYFDDEVEDVERRELERQGRLHLLTNKVQSNQESDASSSSSSSFVDSDDGYVQPIPAKKRKLSQMESYPEYFACYFDNKTDLAAIMGNQVGDQVDDQVDLNRQLSQSPIISSNGGSGTSNPNPNRTDNKSAPVPKAPISLPTKPKAAAKVRQLPNNEICPRETRLAIKKAVEDIEKVVPSVSVTPKLDKNATCSAASSSNASVIKKPGLSTSMEEPEADPISTCIVQVSQYEYKCAICGKARRNLLNPNKALQMLKLHILCVHYDEQSAFTCSTCHKRFESQKSLTLHSRSHFVQKSKSKRTQSQKKSRTKTPSANFVCGICTKLCRSIGALNKHINATHGGKDAMNVNAVGTSKAKPSVKIKPQMKSKRTLETAAADNAQCTSSSYVNLDEYHNAAESSEDDQDDPLGDSLADTPVSTTALSTPIKHVQPQNTRQQSISLTSKTVPTFRSNTSAQTSFNTIASRLELRSQAPPRIQLARPSQPRMQLAGPSQPMMQLAGPSLPRIQLARPSQPRMLQLARPSQPRLQLARPSRPRMDLTRPNQPRMELPKPIQPVATERSSYTVFNQDGKSVYRNVTIAYVPDDQDGRFVCCGCGFYKNNIPGGQALMEVKSHIDDKHPNYTP